MAKWIISWIRYHIIVNENQLKARISTCADNCCVDSEIVWSVHETIEDAKESLLETRQFLDNFAQEKKKCS